MKFREEKGVSMYTSEVTSLREAQLYIIGAYVTKDFREKLTKTTGISEKLSLIRREIFPMSSNRVVDAALVAGLCMIDSLQFKDQRITKETGHGNVFEVVCRFINRRIFNAEYLLIKAFLADVLLKFAEEKMGDIGWSNLPGVILCGNGLYPKEIGVVLTKDTRDCIFQLLRSGRICRFIPQTDVPVDSVQIFGHQYDLTDSCRCESDIPKMKLRKAA